MALDAVVTAFLWVAFVALCFLLLAVQAFSWVWARRIERDLRGQEGGTLAAMILTIATGVLVAQIAVCASVLLAAFARDWSSMLRLILVVAAQSVLAYSFVVVMLRARALSRGLPIQSDWQTPLPEGSEDDEGVGIEVDEIGPGTAVAVDDDNPYAPI